MGVAVFIWSKEASGGPHSHILLQLPSHKSRGFRTNTIKQIKKLTGLRTLPKGTIQNRRIWSHGDPFQHMRNRLAYILKRADEDTRQILNAHKRDIGRIDGKQTGVSQSLGEAEQGERAGFGDSHRDIWSDDLEFVVGEDLIRFQRRVPLEGMRHIARSEQADGWVLGDQAICRSSVTLAGGSQTVAVVPSPGVL